MTVQPPTRIRHTYRQHLVAPPKTVFPLLCPVREADWVPGWEARVVYSNSGVAERDCIFTTPDGDAEATWIVTEYDPAAFRIGFVKLTPGEVVVRIHIALSEDGTDRTEAMVTYTYTALSDVGRARVEAMTAEAYAAFMRTWEDALNHYLRTGMMLPSA